MAGSSLLEKVGFARQKLSESVSNTTRNPDE
jgi:hypothetical protein